MWSFFSRDPTKVFPYDIGEKIEGDDEYSIWTLHDGKHKTNGQAVSIFAFNVSENSEVCKQTALSAIKRLRTLRHPNVLTFIDSLESDKFIYLVSEPVKPLALHLKNLEGNHEFETSWGLHQIVKGLGFLINSVNLIHNNVCLSSMFVNPAGEWKLGGVDYMYPASGEGSNIPPCKPLPSLEKYETPEKSGTRSKKSHKWSVDMWGLGCLVWEVYNGRLPRSSALKVINKIPKNLLKNYCELVSANPLSRPSPEKFLEGCCSNNGFMANHYVTTNLFLEEIQIKDQQAQIAFFDDLTSHLDDFPVAYSKYKILPQLLNVYQYGNAGPTVLPPLFKLGKLLGEEEYQALIVPCVIKLFTSTDRATRIHLLRQLPLFAEHLKPQVVNSQVFPNMVTGFMDTNPAIREQTVKGMLLLAPKLNDANLNTELMKHFARLQARDDQGPIRTNTTVCLGKITQYLNPVTRQRVITSAFGRAMKDPFPAARTAGVLAMVNTIKYFSLKDCAYKAIPSLSALTVDPDKGVREHVFKSMRTFIDKLQEASDDPEKAAQIDEEANVLDATPVAANPAKWAGWMATGVTSLTSKLYATTAAAAAASKTTPGQQQQTNNTAAPSQAVTKEKETVKSEKVETSPSVVEGGDQDGWDNSDNSDWDEPDAEEKCIKVVQGLSLEDDEKGNQSIIYSPILKTVGDRNDGEWEDDDDRTNRILGEMEMKIDPSWDPWGTDSSEKKNMSDTPKQDVVPSNTYNWNDTPVTSDNGGDFFNDFSSNTKAKKTLLGKRTPKPSISKTTAPPPTGKSVPTPTVEQVEESGGDEWGWGDEWGGAAAASNEGISKAELAKLEREERRKQRKKELEEKRANRTKLGARKCD